MQRAFIIYIFSIFLLMNNAKAQDTLSGNYTNLKIPTGAHVIKDVIRVTGSFEVAPGAKIEMISELLGHSSVDITESYLDSFEKEHIQKETDVLTIGFRKAN